MEVLEILKEGFNIDITDIKPTQTIIITIDPDIIDIDVASEFMKQLQKYLPQNKIICVIKGMEIEVND